MATKEEEKLSKALSGISGEYFVAGELSRRGFIAAVTLRNTRGADILVSRPGGKKSATIQVKTIQKGTTEWLLTKADELPKGPNHYYVFVALNGADGHPQYHIVKGNYVARCCKEGNEEWLKGTRRDGKPRKETDMRVFKPGKKFLGKWSDIQL